MYFFVLKYEPRPFLQEIWGINTTMEQKIKKGGVKNGTLFLLFFVVLLGGGVAVSAFVQGGTEHSVLAPGTLEQLILVSLEVEGAVYEVSMKPGSSVYDVMVQARKTSDLSFEGSQFAGLGFFVEEVNGLRQNPKIGKYWLYYINGTIGNVGISMYKVEINDVISWKYEKEYE